MTLELMRSLEAPHPHSRVNASLGLQSWAAALPPDDTEILDPAGGVAVQWNSDQGWKEQHA